MSDERLNGGTSSPAFLIFVGLICLIVVCV